MPHPPLPLFLSSNTCIASRPLSPQMSLHLAPFSQGGHFDLFLLSLLETSVLCDVEAYMYACPSSTPTVSYRTKVHIPKLQSSCSDSGMASEGDSRWWGRFNWRMCPEVQPPAMLGPRCASFHGHNVFFFSISLLRILGELTCDASAAMTGDWSKVN